MKKKELIDRVNNLQEQVNKMQEIIDYLDFKDKHGLDYVNIEREIIDTTDDFIRNNGTYGVSCTIKIRYKVQYIYNNKLITDYTEEYNERYDGVRFVEFYYTLKNNELGDRFVIINQNTGRIMGEKIKQSIVREITYMLKSRLIKC